MSASTARPELNDVEGSQLIAQAMEGDKAALAELLQRHGPAVRRQLEGRIDPRWRSYISEDDVLQQTYADALLGIRGFQPSGEDAFERWLSRMARNNLIDAVRHLEAEKNGGGCRQIQEQTLLDSSVSLLDRLQGSSATASWLVMRREAVEVLHLALGRLPPAYSEVIRLYDLNGWASERVAETLRIRPGAMFMRRNRGLAMLRQWLAAHSCFESFRQMGQNSL